MPKTTPEQRLVAIFQEVGLDQFKKLCAIIIIVNSPKRERKKSVKTTRKEQEGFAVVEKGA